MTITIRWISVLATAAMLGGPLSVASAENLSPLRVAGRHFVDDAGRAVILRGVNLTGDAKVPPFLPSAGPSDLDRVASWGMNVVRMLFLWEAYEPLPGVYDEHYLASLCSLAGAAAARGVYTIVDIHQDGYSRHVSRGAGDGFPAWAVSRRGTISVPDNSPQCSNWPILMATDPTTHRSFHDFFADAGGVRSRFLQMIGRIASDFATVPGVIGYDLLNEPWGDERRDLAPLYEDMAAVIRAHHPAAILFVEGHVTSNCGMATWLPRPSYGGFAYAPHYYKPLALVMMGWRSTRLLIDHGFRSMGRQAQRWDCPLFVGEFGFPAPAKNADEYMSAVYDDLDALLASGAQWNLTPGWDPQRKDGWNGEDFSIVDAAGNLRPNFRPRPYPRATAGTPRRFEFHDNDERAGGRALLFTWDHQPACGVTEIAIPDGLFRPGTRVESTPGNILVRHDPARRALVCYSPHAGPITVRVSEPAIMTMAESGSPPHS
jgi:endoglycosylceramidase